MTFPYVFRCSFFLEVLLLKQELYMQTALALAKKGCGRVSPNPMVGAVIVKDGRIIGQGYHAQYGGIHAERAALAACTESPKDADLYVTLEPCCHHGKQPPCTDAVIESGIRRVFIGASDPNPLVSGKGANILRAHGVEVVEGVLAGPCTKLNEIFFHFIQTGRPYVLMKYAMTLDGKIAAASGASRFITGAEARRRVHKDRNRYAAIMVGVNTILSDDPLLTCRLPEGRNPIRIVCDTALRTPEKAQVVATAKSARTLLATCVEDPARHRPYLSAGCEIMVLPKQAGHVSLPALTARLGAQGIDSVILEGGAALHWSALKSGIVQAVQAYIAPKLFGGKCAPSPIGGAGVLLPQDAFRLTPPVLTKLGEDFLLESGVIPCSPAS